MPRRKGASEAHGVCVCGNVPSRAAEASVEVFVAGCLGLHPREACGLFLFHEKLEGGGKHAAYEIDDA